MSVRLTQLFSGLVKARLNLAIEDTVCHVVILPQLFLYEILSLLHGILYLPEKPVCNEL